MLNDNQQAQLRKLFYSDNNLRNLQNLRLDTKELPYNDVKAWYNAQEVVQLTRPAPIAQDRTGESYMPIITWSPFERLYLDTMFFKAYKLTILCGIDLFSRYAFAMPFYGEIGISSTQALKALQDFLEQIKGLGYKAENIYTDAGSEFKLGFKSYCNDHHLNIITSSPNDPRKNRNIERFNKTLRLLVEKWVVLYGKKITKKDVTALIKSYNNTVHSSLDGYKPIDVLKDPKKAQELWKYYIDVKFNHLDKKHKTVLAVGTWVRWFIRKDSPFKKTGKNWSKTLYKVASYNPANQLYSLEGLRGGYRREYLQVVNKAEFDDYNYNPPRRTPSPRDDDRPRKSVRNDTQAVNIVVTPRQRKTRKILDL